MVCAEKGGAFWIGWSSDLRPRLSVSPLSGLALAGAFPALTRWANTWRRSAAHLELQVSGQNYNSFIRNCNSFIRNYNSVIRNYNSVIRNCNSFLRNCNSFIRNYNAVISELQLIHSELQLSHSELSHSALQPRSFRTASRSFGTATRLFRTVGVPSELRSVAAISAGSFRDVASDLDL